MSDLATHIEGREPTLRIRVPVRPFVIPVELVDLAAHVEVRHDYGTSGFITGSGISRACDLISQIQATIARQKDGKFHPDEAAHLLAEAQGIDARSLLNRMEEAFRSGRLVVREWGSDLQKSHNEPWSKVGDILFVADIDAWLTAQGVSYRFPKTEEATDTSPATEEQAEYPFDLLATRQELVDAFGRFVGMDLSWFKSLNDAPALRDARKIVGRAGKPGHATEPMFCPFEVMTYVTKPGRRVKQPLSAEKAWALLERHFPRVYSVRQIGDPRNPD